MNRSGQKDASWGAWLLAGLGVPHLLGFIYVALLRIGYPFELEWQEGTFLQAVIRLREGLPLFPEPSLDYVSWLYTPGFYYAGWLASLFVGESLTALRLVSFIAAIGCFGLLFRLVQARLGAAYGLLAAGLFASAYLPSGNWYDLARVDSLALCLSLAAIWRAMAGLESWKCRLFAASLAAAAILTKQNSLFTLLPVYLVLLMQTPRDAILTGLLIALVGGVASVCLYWFEGEWVFYYLLEMPRHHGWEDHYLWRFWGEGLAEVMPVATAAAAIGCCMGLPARQGRLLVAAAIGLVLTAYIARLHVGGYVNTLMPAYAAIALMAPFGLSALMQKQWSSPAFSPLVLTGLTVLLASHFWFLRYDPQSLLPSDAHREHQERLLGYLQAIEGSVWVPTSPYLAWKAGKGFHAHHAQLADIWHGGLDQAPGDALWQELEARIHSHYYRAVLAGRPETTYDQLADAAGYLPLETLFGRIDPVAVRSPAGWPHVPHRIWEYRVMVAQK